MKGSFNEDIDKNIIDCLNYKAQKISAPDDMLFKIRISIRNENKLRSSSLKKIKSLKARTAIIIGILCIAIAVPVTAEKINLHWFRVQNETKNIVSEFPTSDILEKELGCLPKYLENLNGGFKFKSFNGIDNLAKDKAGNKVINTKVGEFEYTRDVSNGNQYLKMTAMKIDKEYFYEDVKPIMNYDFGNKGTKIYWTYVVRKEVPVDYVETKEDIKFIKDGSLDLTFGSDKINLYSLKYVLWYEDGIKYMIINKKYDDINIPEMINMAKNIMNK